MSSSLHITVGNPPAPPKPATCTRPGCPYEPRWCLFNRKWLCNWHYYRFLKDTEDEAA